MAKAGPIIIIEDDTDDQDIMTGVLKELNVDNDVICFSTGIEVIPYLKTTIERPFLIFCDVNLPLLNGLDLKRQIDADPELRKKSIPFLFYSTSVDQLSVNTAYTQMTVQGFFQKSSSYQEIKKMVGLIIDYWKYCRHPNC